MMHGGHFDAFEQGVANDKLGAKGGPARRPAYICPSFVL